MQPSPVLFKDLPATFPENDKHKTPAAISSIAIHAGLLTTVFLIPLLMPQHIERWQLLAMVAPLAPPPAPPPPSAPIPVEEVAKPEVPVIQPVIKVDPGTVVSPTEIPKEIARIIEAPEPGVGGVPGGVLNGAIGGVLRGVLFTSSKPVDVAPAPPPPPPPPPPPIVAPTAPLRVGGEIKEPKLIKLVPAIYPKLAIKARVKGLVILEAIVTAEGTVDEIRVISGNPLLNDAAVDCVKQWRYEPTYLNGEPVPVILTARVTFELGPPL